MAEAAENEVKDEEQAKPAATKPSHPEFRAGDKLRVHVTVREGEKERIQVFEGHVISRNHGQGASFTIRKVSFGIGVERIFPIDSPLVNKIEVVSRGDVRRSRIYYLRKLRGKAARIATVQDQK